MSEERVVHQRHVTQGAGQEGTIRLHFPILSGRSRVPDGGASRPTVSSGRVQGSESTCSLYRFFYPVHSFVVAATSADRLGEILEHGPGRMVEVTEIALYPRAPGYRHVVRGNSSHSKQIRLVTD